MKSLTTILRIAPLTLPWTLFAETTEEVITLYRSLLAQNQEVHSAQVRSYFQIWTRAEQKDVSMPSRIEGVAPTIVSKRVPDDDGIVISVYGPFDPDKTQKLWLNMDKNGEFERIHWTEDKKVIGVVVEHGANADRALLESLRNANKKSTQAESDPAQGQP